MAGAGPEQEKHVRTLVCLCMRPALLSVISAAEVHIHIDTLHTHTHTISCGPTMCHLLYHLRQSEATYKILTERLAVNPNQIPRLQNTVLTDHDPFFPGQSPVPERVVLWSATSKAAIQCHHGTDQQHSRSFLHSA